MSWENLITVAHSNLVNTLSESCTYVQDDLYSYQVSGIFGERFFENQATIGASTISTTPTIGVKKTDLFRMPVDGDKIIIRTKTYLIYETKEDGEGFLELLLHLE